MPLYGTFTAAPMPSRGQKKTNDERLMTMAELAAYLHLGQKTVLRLATTNKLPGLLVDNQWRFKRSAVDAWLEDQFEDPGELEEVPDGMHVPLGDLLSDEGMLHDLQARDALAVIEELAARAYANRWLADKPWFVGALVERESLASTAMEGGVAFLHTRVQDKGKIVRPFVLVGRSYNGIDYGGPDGRPTYLFFLLGLKYDRMHLPILGRLARIMRNPQTVSRLRALPSGAKMRAFLLQEDAAALAAPRAAPVFANAAAVDRKDRLRVIMRRAAVQKHRASKQQPTAPRKRKK
jgi:PTS system nitrogen regulatory IIA component